MMTGVHGWMTWILADLVTHLTKLAAKQGA